MRSEANSIHTAFELLESHMPFLQSALGDRLEYELTFNDYARTILATGDAAASYTIENISLEFDMVSNPELARLIHAQYAGRLAILYERVLRHRKLRLNKSDTVWNINLNSPARSLKGILMIFEDPAAAFQRDTERFYNPGLLKVEVTCEGLSNQLYSQGLRSYQQWDEARKLNASGSKRHPVSGMVAKDLALADVSLSEYLTTKYALGRRPAPRHGPSNRERQRGHYHPDHQEARARRAIGRLYFSGDGRSTKPGGCPHRVNYLLAAYPPQPTQSSVGRQDVARRFSPLISSRGPTAESSSTSSYFARRSATTKPTMAVRGSGQILRCTLSTQVNDCTIGFAFGTAASKASRPCTSSMTAAPRKR